MSVLNCKVKNKPLFGELAIGDILYERYSNSNRIVEYIITKVEQLDNDNVKLHYKDNVVKAGQRCYYSVEPASAFVILRSNFFTKVESYITTYKPKSNEFDITEN